MNAHTTIAPANDGRPLICDMATDHIGLGEARAARLLLPRSGTVSDRARR